MLAQGADLAPIPGTKRIAYLEENLAAAQVVLSDAVRVQLDALFAADNVAGARYAPEAMRSVDQD